MAQYNTTAGALLAVNDARCQGLIAQIKRRHRASNWGRASLFSESETFDRAATDWRNKRGNHGAGVGQRSNSSLSLALRLSLSRSAIDDVIDGRQKGHFCRLQMGA